MRNLSEMSVADLHAYTVAVYENLAKAVTEHLEAKSAYATARYSLDARLSSGIYNGEISGRNEAERTGQAMEKFPELFVAVEQTQTKMWETEVKMQVAKLDEAQLTLGVKLFEMATV